MKKLFTLFPFLGLLIFNSGAFATHPTSKAMIDDQVSKTLTIRTPDKNLTVVISYAKGCVIKKLEVKGKNTLSDLGIYTGFSTDNDVMTSANSSSAIKLSKRKSGVTISNITFGNNVLAVTESWDFDVVGSKVVWKIRRIYNNDANLQDMAFPKWNFASLDTWKGGILDNGGMVWCKYLKQPNDTYGVHTGGVTYWNAETGNGLSVAVKTDKGNHLAAKYANNNGTFTATQMATESELGQRYNLNRFIGGRYDVFAPFKVTKGAVDITIELNYLDYFKHYSRGNLPGIDAVAVRELMNTTGRYGVVDNNIIGANGWLTNWKCLHEPFFAQIGLALNDANYTRNFAATLDQERDLAIQDDGRVLSRWHNAPGDEMPGTYNKKTGYYEAMWGYTIDSQPGQVINTCEQFNLTGDVAWLKSHQQSMQKVLDWLIRRDSNNNGIFEMKNDNIKQKKASDWLDIVWASYENSFVNAQMYEALKLWSECERILKNEDKANYYSAVAAKLKQTFNKPIEEGGFWSEEKKQYVYWRDNDGTVHGDNLVTPVNFAVIAFKLCDDERRIKLILDQIEERTAKENLFHWPLCFDSFKQEEVSPGNWPFPNYENGDIFPTWGYLGVRAYANYNVNVAVKYINKLLAQYHKDGLSSQRYSRTTQKGLGDDILAGICTSVTALYSDIYGIQPKWNRMGIRPNIPNELSGANFNYTLRDTTYRVRLDKNNYSLSTDKFNINAKQAFGVSNKDKDFTIYTDNKEDMVLFIKANSVKKLNLQIENFIKGAELSWIINSNDQYKFKLNGLNADKRYDLVVNGKKTVLRASADGTLTFARACANSTRFSLKLASN